MFQLRNKHDKLQLRTLVWRPVLSVILFQFEEQFLDSTSPTPSDLLECVAHECPDLMRKGKAWIKQNNVLVSPHKDTGPGHAKQYIGQPMKNSKGAIWIGPQSLQ